MKLEMVLKKAIRKWSGEELINLKITTFLGKTLLKKDDGGITKKDNEVLEEMRKYIKLNCYQENDKIEKEIINNEPRGDLNNWNTDLNNINNNIKTKREF